MKSVCYHLLFNSFDHIYGAFKVRIYRNYCKIRKKPDISIITDSISIGGSATIEGLSKKGVSAIVDLRYEDIDDLIQLEKYSIDYLRVGIEDRGIPTETQAKEIVNWIDERINNGNKVFIHCNLGRGRAPTIACLYLISNGMTFRDSISLVKKNRTYTYFNKKQLKFIQEFKII